MKNFWTIYKYELEKILNRKALIFTCFVLWLLLTAVGVGSIFFETYTGQDGTERINAYEYTMKYRDNAKTYTGREVNEDLLDEYRQEHNESLTNRFHPLYYLLKGLVGPDTALLGDENSPLALEEELYAARLRTMETQYDEQGLNEAEKDFWRDQEREVSKPIVFEYVNGWTEVLANITFMKVVTLLLITILLANVFSGERLRRTDQLILSSPLRQREVYYSKMLASLTIGFALAVLCLFLSSIPTLMIWGFDGFGAQIQLALPTSPLDKTIGWLIVHVALILLTSMMYYALFIAFLSELIDNSMSVVGISFALIMLSLFFRMPQGMGVLEKIYNYFPTKVFSNFNDVSLFYVFDGHYLNVYEFLPVYYIVNIVFLVIIGRFLYFKWIYR